MTLELPKALDALAGDRGVSGREGERGDEHVAGRTVEDAGLRMVHRICSVVEMGRTMLGGQGAAERILISGGCPSPGTRGRA